MILSSRSLVNLHEQGIIDMIVVDSTGAEMFAKRPWNIRVL